jgi:hypothetical protein
MINRINRVHDWTLTKPFRVAILTAEVTTMAFIIANCIHQW